MSTLLEVKNLNVSFRGPQGVPIQAVANLSFQVKAGSTLAIVGESGSGKSVAMLSVMGLIQGGGVKVHADALRFNEVDLRQQSAAAMRQHRGANLAMIFQDPMTALNPYLTIGLQLREAITAHHQETRKNLQERCLQALAEVGLPDPKRHLQQYPHQLSGGMRQRVMIAMAMINDPALLLCDEPTTALDVSTQSQILTLLKSLQQRKGTGIIFVTHDLNVARSIADEILVMYAGRAVEEGAAADVLNAPRHPYTKGLLQSLPKIGSKERLVPIDGLPPDPTALPLGCAFVARCPVRQERCILKPVPSYPLSATHQVSCYTAEAPHG